MQKLIGMRRLNFKCDHPECQYPAIFALTYKEEEKEGNKLQVEVGKNYCREHLPKEALLMWQEELDRV